jgi:CRISPR/Cas system-associated exonuclease Cas4 (RecB family)
MMGDENKTLIADTYGEVVSNYCNANKEMYRQLVKCRDEGNTKDMRLCFDALTLGLQEMKSHMDMASNSNFANTKTVMREITGKAETIMLEVKEIVKTEPAISPEKT